MANNRVNSTVSHSSSIAMGPQAARPRSAGSPDRRADPVWKQTYLTEPLLTCSITVLQGVTGGAYGAATGTQAAAGQDQGYSAAGYVAQSGYGGQQAGYDATQQQVRASPTVSYLCSVATSACAHAGCCLPCFHLCAILFDTST